MQQVNTLTVEQATEQARELARRHKCSVTVGRHLHSSRRYSIGIRCCESHPIMFTDGSRWVPLRTILPTE